MINERLLEIFLQLVKIEGLSNSEKSVASYITYFLKNLGLSPYEDNSKEITKGNTGNIICKIGSGGSFVLVTHMDTARSTKDVNPQIRKDRISSDGTTVLGVDNRAGIAVILYTIEKVKKEKIHIKDFTAAFVTNEETTLDGSRNVNLDENIKMGFIFDSHLRPGYFINGSCGAADFFIRVIGKASHSGIAPEKGIDAISIASKAIAATKLGRLDEESTANIGTIQGGIAANVVPDEIVLEGEVRSINLSKVKKKLEEIKNKFNEFAHAVGGDIKFECRWDFMPYKIDPEMEVYKRIEEVLRKVGLSPEAKISWGGSDANSLNERGIHSVNIGIGAQNPHSNDEFILFEDLQKSHEIALELIKK